MTTVITQTFAHAYAVQVNKLFISEKLVLHHL